jgi:hypothetical protein
MVTFNRIIRGVVNITIQQNCKVSRYEWIPFDNIYEVITALAYSPARLQLCLLRQHQYHAIIRERQRISLNLEGSSVRQHLMDSLFLRHTRIVTGH